MKINTVVSVLKILLLNSITMSYCLAEAYTLSLIIFSLSYIFSTVLPARTNCKVGFEKIGKWCFYIHLQSNSLSKSREICEKMGGNMVLLDEYIKIESLRKYIEGKVVLLLNINEL